MVASNGTVWRATSYSVRFRSSPVVRSDPAARTPDCDVALAWALGHLEVSDPGATAFAGCGSFAFPARRPLNERESLSGITRVAHPYLGQGSDEQEQILERFLADQLNLIISGALEGTRHLFKGPLLRKLRGRLAYQLLDPRRITPLAIDWDDRTVRQVCPRSGSWEYRWSKESKHISCRCYGPYPSLTLDAGVRHFELVVGKWRYLVDAPLCALPPSEAKSYFEEMVPELLEEVATAILAATPRGETAPLPALLQVADSRAEDELTLASETEAHVRARVHTGVQLDLREVGRVVTKYRVAPSERLQVNAHIRDWVEEMNRAGRGNPSLVPAIIAEFRELEPPLRLVAARPKDLQWLKETLSRIAEVAKQRCSHVGRSQTGG